MINKAAPMNVSVRLLLLLSSCLVLLSGVTAQTQCQNGGTFDPVSYSCLCTPDFYGKNCETAFSSSDPCSNPSIPELNDAAGAHSPNNTQPCSVSGGCISFVDLASGWYRLKSPAGGELTTACTSSLDSCGSAYPHILTNIMQEANANINLKKGRLYMVQSTNSPVCYYPESNYYSVRILGCASFNLYYLGPTSSSRHHYCIGNRMKCGAGLVSSDGSGYEPCQNAASCVPRLKSGALPPAMEQVKITRNGEDYTSYFNCTVQDSYETNLTTGVLYEVTYRLTYHNGTKRLLDDDCKKSNLAISPGGSTRVACSDEYLLLTRAHGENIYGGTLECVVKAKCNSEAASYISQEIASLPHRFEFDFQLVDSQTNASTSVITPSEPIQVCVNISKVPIFGKVNISVTARRQALTASDKITSMIGSSNGNDSSSSSKYPCLNELKGRLVNYTKLCLTLALVNEDEDGLIVYGLDKTQMTPTIEVTLNYFSTDPSGGVYTGGKLERLQSRQLTIDLRPLYSIELKDYFHIFTDPYAKPANSSVAYLMSEGIHPGTYRVVSLLKHSFLPYEVQVVDSHDVPIHSRLVKLAVRYEHYLITIQSSEGKFKFETRELQKSALPLTDKGVPKGVTIEMTDTAVRVKFDLYGTIIYLWGFIPIFDGQSQILATAADGRCMHQFVMTRGAISENTCTRPTLLWSANGLDAFDMQIVPGFYDTPNRIDGIMYRPNFASWKSTDIVVQGSSRDMFSPNFVADEVKESLLKPTEWMNFCSCSNSTEFDESRCAIKVEGEPTRTKRSIKWDQSVEMRRSNGMSVASTGQQTAVITESMAAQHCDRFVQAMTGAGKSGTVSECTKTTGILGSVDYISQFKMVCALYAVQLNSFNYTEAVFKSIVGQCVTSLSFDVPTVQLRPNTLTQMKQELCPNNCSGNGACYSGACQCRIGFAGPACQVSSSAASSESVEVALVNMDNTGPLCSSRNCTTVYLSVSPFLKSANPACVVRSNGSDGFEERKTSEPLASNVVGCSLQGALDSIKSKNKLYMALSVQLAGSDWSSSNSAGALVYQESCKAGTAVCSTSTMSCFIADAQQLGNVCEPASAPAPAAESATISGAASLTLLLALGVLLAGFWVPY